MGLQHGHDRLSVWIVEDDERARASLKQVIDAADDLSCERDFASAEDLLREMESPDTHAPTVVIMDIGLPGMDGIEAIGHLRPLSPATEVLIHSVHEDNDRIYRALCAGASGYLTKSSTVPEIREAIWDVVGGGGVLSRPIARRVIDMLGRRGATPHDYGLTPREQEVLEVMGTGVKKKQIARKLGVSINTVDTHMRNIYAKLHVTSMTGAVAKAWAEGLVGKR